MASKDMYLDIKMRLLVSSRHLKNVDDDQA